MYPWGDTPADEHHVSKYAVGEHVYSGPHRGTVTKVSTVVGRIISVVWDEGDGDEVIYPMDTENVRKAHPWEL